MSEEVELQQAAVEITPEQAVQQPETAPEQQTNVDTTEQRPIKTMRIIAFEGRAKAY